MTSTSNKFDSRKIIAACVASILVLGATNLASAQFQNGEEAARDAMARAMAEKARNDEIVRQQQMEQERQRQQQEQQLRDLEEAQRRSTTG
ncbi:hypothetical protein EN813_038410 [Mesorhizobium sp. M00.F.Ca.ET.170.01.1.1]|nr:hypothetical protein EN813_038410 [Mesorhizobium sp. M00.F.Ca.ET.170.01.1.1]